MLCVLDHFSEVPGTLRPCQQLGRLFFDPVCRLGHGSTLLADHSNSITLPTARTTCVFSVSRFASLATATCFDRLRSLRHLDDRPNAAHDFEQCLPQPRSTSACRTSISLPQCWQDFLTILMIHQPLSQVAFSCVSCERRRYAMQASSDSCGFL